METDRFDHLTERFFAAGTRRGLLQLLPLVGGLSAFRRAESAAKKGKAKKKCKKPCGPCKKCKQGKCKPKPSGTVCGTHQVCQEGVCIVRACGAGGPCHVFLSSAAYQGNLGGLSGADAKCQGLAAAAGLPGTYKAWLSDATNAPATRFVHSTGPYRLVNGTTIAANWTDLTDGNLAAPINVTETGGTAANTSVWTFTQSNGTQNDCSGCHCANWSTNGSSTVGGIGSAVKSNDDWTDMGTGLCHNFGTHLYCFQQS